MIPFPTAVQDTRVQLAKMPREAKIRLWGALEKAGLPQVLPKSKRKSPAQDGKL